MLTALSFSLPLRGRGTAEAVDEGLEVCANYRLSHKTYVFYFKTNFFALGRLCADEKDDCLQKPCSPHPSPNGATFPAGEG